MPNTRGPSQRRKLVGMGSEAVGWERLVLNLISEIEDLAVVSAKRVGRSGGEHIDPAPLRRSNTGAEKRPRG